MKKLLSMLVIPVVVLLALPVAAGAAALTPSVFDGSYSYHGTVFDTTSHCPTGHNPSPVTAHPSGHFVVAGGALYNHAIHFVFSDHKDGDVTIVTSAGGLTITEKYSFSLSFG